MDLQYDRPVTTAHNKPIKDTSIETVSNKSAFKSKQSLEMGHKSVLVLVFAWACYTRPLLSVNVCSTRPIRISWCCIISI